MTEENWSTPSATLYTTNPTWKIVGSNLDLHSDRPVIKPEPQHGPKHVPNFETLKGKVLPVHGMKAYRGNGGIVPLILNLGTQCRWVVSFMMLRLYTWGNSPRHPLNRRLGRPHSQSGQLEEENLLTLTGIILTRRSNILYKYASQHTPKCDDLTPF
jgi:hypothetical protein